jgi:hypothetical protein
MTRFTVNRIEMRFNAFWADAPFMKGREMNYDKDYLQAGYLFNKMAAQAAAGETFEKDAGLKEIWEWLKKMYGNVAGYFGGGAEAAAPGTSPLTGMRIGGEGPEGDEGYIKRMQEFAGGLPEGPPAPADPSVFRSSLPSAIQAASKFQAPELPKIPFTFDNAEKAVVDYFKRGLPGGGD